MFLFSCENIPDKMPDDLTINFSSYNMLDQTGYIINKDEMIYYHFFIDRQKNYSSPDRIQTLFVKKTDEEQFKILISDLRKLSLNNVKTYTDYMILSQPGGSTFNITWDKKSIRINDSGSSYVRPYYTNAYSKARQLVSNYFTPALKENIIKLNVRFSNDPRLSKSSIKISPVKMKNIYIQKSHYSRNDLEDQSSKKEDNFNIELSEGEYVFTCEYNINELSPKAFSKNVKINNELKIIQIINKDDGFEFAAE